MPEPESADADAKSSAPATSKDGASEGGAESEKGGVPAGVVPLFLTGAGQHIFQCIVDQDVTPEAPNKLISKEKILEDFRNRAAVSDFHPVKKKVQARKYFYIMHTTLLMNSKQSCHS